MSKTFAPIAVLVKVITPKAVLTSDGFNEVWIPKSLIDEDDVDSIEANEFNEINVQEWFLKKEGLL